MVELGTHSSSESARLVTLHLQLGAPELYPDHVRICGRLGAKFPGPTRQLRRTHPLADAIINRLGYVNQLTIRPSYAVQKYRSEIPDIQQVARSLSVDTLLTGSFIREGDNLRVSYQLVDAVGNRILRQGTVDVKYQNLLAVQDDVSAQVISALALTLSPAETENLRTQQAIPPLAYEYYLRGVDLYSRGDFPLAIKMLEKSTEIYPDYALTWAHLGRTYTASASFNFGGAELYSKAKQLTRGRCRCNRRWRCRASTWRIFLLTPVRPSKQFRCCAKPYGPIPTSLKRIGSLGTPIATAAC
jgi:TolB-like protein